MRGTRYCVRLMASASPLNRAHSPKNSERMVTTMCTAVARPSDFDRRRRRSLSCLDIAAYQQIDEKLGFLAARFLLEAEQLLELVDQNAQTPALEAFQRTGDRGQRRPTAVELTDNVADALGIVGRRRPAAQIPWPGSTAARLTAAWCRSARRRRRADAARSSFGSTPARTSEDFPAPEAP